MANSNVANAAKESAHAEFPYSLFDFCTVSNDRSGVDLIRSPSRRRMTAMCAHRTTGVDVKQTFRGLLYADVRRSGRASATAALGTEARGQDYEGRRRARSPANSAWRLVFVLANTVATCRTVSRLTPKKPPPHRPPCQRPTSQPTWPPRQSGGIQRTIALLPVAAATPDRSTGGSSDRS